MNVWELLAEKREDILRLAAAHGAANVRVFGSAVRGDAGPDSDVDFLVELKPGSNLLHLWADLEALLGREVDVVPEDMLHWYIRERVLAHAVPLEAIQAGFEGNGDEMPGKDDMLYLLHIRDAIAAVEEYVADGRETFMSSRLVQDATLRNMQTLAESTQQLSDGAKAAHPEVDWAGIAAFRNVFVHGYLSIDLEIVWGIIEHDLPVLKRAVQDIMAEADSSQENRAQE